MLIRMDEVEAKAQLSELLDAAADGDDVVISRSGRAVVRLVPVMAPAARHLGFMPIDVDDEIFAPLDGDASGGE
jgi:antitoxin (DNA-binding transcriptional repressor) of toxin-antitoxin stability system